MICLLKHLFGVQQISLHINKIIETGVPATAAKRPSLEVDTFFSCLEMFL